PAHLRIAHSKPRAARSLALLRRHAQIGLDVEQIVLDAAKLGSEQTVVCDMQAGNAHHRVDLIERAISGNAQIVLLAPLAGPKRGRTITAAAGIDPVEDDHAGLFSVPSPRSSP